MTNSKLLGWTVQITDENDGLPRLLASGIRFGGVPTWYPVDAEALASFTQRERPPWGHIWLSSRDAAEDAAHAVRGTICAVEEDAERVITIRPIDPIAEAVAAEREEIAKMVEKRWGPQVERADEIAESIRARATTS